MTYHSHFLCLILIFQDVKPLSFVYSYFHFQMAVRTMSIITVCVTIITTYAQGGLSCVILHLNTEIEFVFAFVCGLL